MCAAASSPPALAAAYGLPAAGDAAAWERLMRPCTGRLQLVDTSGPWRGGGTLTRPHPKLTTVTLWVHCGLHYQVTADAPCTPPAPGDLPATGGGAAGARFGFFPLRRDAPDAATPPASHVRVFCAGPAERLHGLRGRWGVAVAAPAGASQPQLLRLCARSRADADAWAHQLRARSAPLAAVWARVGGDAGGRPAGVGGDGSAGGGPARATPASAVAVVRDGARRVLAGDLVASVAGVVAAVVAPDSYDLAVAAGPVAGVALGALAFAVRVLVAARSAFGAAAEVSADLDELYGKLVEHVLPSLQSLPDDGSVGVGDLMNKLGLLVADVEVLAGDLHHLVRSRQQRVSLAIRAAHRGADVGSDFFARLRAARRSADRLIQLIQLGLLRRSVAIAVQTRHAVEAASPHATALRAVRKELPPRPPNVFNRWDDEGLPAAQLYAAVIQSDSTTCAAVGVHGQGGVGKTLSCLLVAHRVAGEADGRRRFPHGVHWVQLSQESAVGDVKQRVCDLAATLTGAHVVANELDVAVGYLRAALQAKSSLVIVDDVWDDRWAAIFISALRASAGSCLLLSTRHMGIAVRTGVCTSVLVGTHGPASAIGVLRVHAEAGGTIWADKTDALVQRAVSVCGGLALALAVMGSLVRERGWTSAVELVDGQRDALPSRNLPVEANYQLSLRTCLLASYRALGVGTDAIEQPLWHARFQALCVVRPKEQLPLDALAALWGEDDPEVVRHIGRTLRDRSLVALHGDEADGTLQLSLHDLVIEFLAYPGLMSQAQREEVHAKMIGKYCERNCIDDGAVETQVADGPSCVTVRKLWELPSDGYIEFALPRLLCASGTCGRLEHRALLFHWRFVAWRVHVGDGSCAIYRMDARVYDMEGARILDRVATVIDGALACPDVTLSERLQQAAWDVMERFASWPRIDNAKTGAHLLPLLLATARSYLKKPAFELYGAARIRLPQECRVFGCNSGVRSICSSVNAQGDVVLISGLTSGQLKCWDERSGRCVEVWEGHTGPVTCTMVLDGDGSDDGRRVVSGSADQTLRVWNVSTGECMAVLRAHTSYVTCLAVLEGYSIDGGKHVVSGSFDSSLRVWDMGRFECEAVLGRHLEAVSCLVSLNDGGARVVSGSYDRIVMVWDVRRRTCVKRMQGHTGQVECLAVLDGCASGGEGRIASSASDHTVRLWDLASGTCMAVFKHDTHMVLGVRALLDGGRSGGAQRIVVGLVDCTVRVWNVNLGSCAAVFRGHTEPVRCLAALDRGGSRGGGNGGSTLVVSGSDDHTMRVWEMDGGEHMTVLDSGSAKVRFLALLDGGGSRDAGRVVSWSADHQVRVWDVDTGKCVASLNGPTSVSCLGTLDGSGSNEGLRLLTGSYDHSLRIWDLSRGQYVAILSGHTRRVTCLAVLNGGGSNGGGRVVTGSDDRTVRVWDLSSDRSVAVLSGHTDSVSCLAVLDAGRSDDGGRVVSGSFDGRLRVWDVSSGLCVAMLSGHTDSVTCLAVLGGGGSGVGQLIVSGSDDRTVRVWDVDGGTCAAVMQCRTSLAQCFVVQGGGAGGGELVVSALVNPPVRPARSIAGLTWTAVSSARAATLSCDSRPQGACAAAAPGAPSWAGGCFALDQRGRCAVIDIRCHAGRWSGHLRYLPVPPGVSAMCSVSPSVLAWGTKDGHVYFGRRMEGGPPA